MLHHNSRSESRFFSVLSHLERPKRQQQLDRFHDKWKDDPLVIDKWLSLQATSKRESTIEDVERLMQHEAFNRKNPNRIRALFGIRDRDAENAVEAVA